MHSDLMHSTRSWFAQHDTCLSIVSKFLEYRLALLTLWWNLADANFITDHFNGFSAFNDPSEKVEICKTRVASQIIWSYSGNSPSTRQTYSFWTCRLRIWCSIWRAFFGLRPNRRRPDVRRSNRWMVRKFFKLYSLARIKTTVLWR